MTDPRSPVRIVLIISGVVAALGAGIIVAVHSSGHGAAMGDEPAMTESEMASIAAEMRIASFEGVDHRGAPIDESVFRGHWTVVSFGFTNCTLACPMLHGEIFRMSEKLADHGVRFLTISVDPDHDTVEAMADYIKPWGVKNDAWTFLRVDRGMVAAMLAGLKMQAITEDPAEVVELPGGGTMANLHHPTRFFVVGPDGAVRGLWRGADPDDVDALVRWVLQRVF